jgi:molybdopterin-guanine dinucleotide biosynthesis protein A
MDQKTNQDQSQYYSQQQNRQQDLDLSQVSLVILAGGKSLRMGMNKAHLNWHDMRFIDALVNKGMQLGFGEILLSGYDGEIDGCRTIPDIKANRGPLGGMYSSFQAARFRNALVVPVDCPGISTSTMTSLARMHLDQENEITLLKHGHRLEPLIGMYDVEFRHKILPVIQHRGAPVFRALDRGHISTCHMKEGDTGVLNLNTKEAYLAWVKKNENRRRSKNIAGD